MMKGPKKTAKTAASPKGENYVAGDPGKLVKQPISKTPNYIKCSGSTIKDARSNIDPGEYGITLSDVGDVIYWEPDGDEDGYVYVIFELKPAAAKKFTPGYKSLKKEWKNISNFSFPKIPDGPWSNG